ncbi:PREDICTED: Niemann-Pick C1 protein-like [Ceratosolen solmsi marchali]|uniref:Niemann-Pick C1 protein-like n=1 Tax=Ceratosolen solmsi marchali TaxID=326594 RepID=A0AAJ7E1T6_9HYME|nr:PREDICTED: Niemann-Pick C1 protein-like [Ceratosolen solmsi marchali]
MKQIYIKLVYVTIFYVQLIQSEDYTCVWYKECGYNEDNKVRNCLSNTTAQLINDEDAEKILVKRCPHLFEDTNQPKTCCDSQQIRTMDSSMEMAEQIFGRCAICLRNLFQSICDFTCSPDQSRFMNATEIKVNKNGDAYIEALEIFLSEEYANSTYDSCKDVVNPSSGMLAMDFGCNGAKDCTPKRWFDYMGNSNINSFVPFFIDYVFNASELQSKFITHSLNPKTKNCSERYDNSTLACSCVDCRLACKVNNIPIYNKAPIDSWNIYGIVAGLTIIGISTLFTIGFYLYGFKRKANNYDLEISFTDSDSNLGKLNKQKTYGEQFRSALQSIFIFIGTFFAQYPISSLAIIGNIAILLSLGVSRLTITSNPIEIWSAPNSRARLEKDFFDKHFQPFYRTEQIFIKSVNLEKFYYNISNEELEFGPIFQKNFLLHVLDLQEKVMKLGQDEDEGLEKICYAPVKNDFSGPMTLSYCTIQSIWGYFKNNIEECNSNYLQKIYECLENPFNINCLAPYKGPIIPAISLGGFLKDGKSDYNANDYIKSTGLVITFLVKFPHDTETLNLALKWEQRFIDFMKNWDKYDRPDFIDVAYSTERSIEDELERTSKAEAVTMILSYLLMFIYISMALGEYKLSYHCFITSRIALSIGGILIVLLSVSCAVGVFGYIGVPTSLLTVEVIPFLVLAVGVDNIFILVREHMKTPRKPDESIPAHIGRIVFLHLKRTIR